MRKILESQIDTSTSDRQLLFDIRSESRKTNELLTQLLEVLRPIARDTVPKEVKKSKPKSKEVKTNGTQPKSIRCPNGGNLSRNGAGHPDKRKTIPDK